MEHMWYAKAISWIDDCRIPFVDGGWGNRNNKDKNIFNSQSLESNPNTQQNNLGRFPANILVCDDMLNDGVISKAGEYKGVGSKSGGIWNNSTGKPAGKEYGDKGTNSRYYDIDKWFEKLLESCG